MIIKPFLVEKPWGGDYISRRLNIIPPKNLGEAFLVSTLLNNESLVDDKSLSSFLGARLPYLVKIIDAADNLSIQVHPNDKWAQILEDSVGKTECWLVLETDEGAGVYYGFKPGFTFDHLINLIDIKQDASQCLNFIPVKQGDFISVPAGTIHAIGRGVKILEFQQSSGITYRIWDWNREGRELHLEKARKVTLQGNVQTVSAFSKFAVGEYFFRHDDFALKKNNQTEIICSSDKTSLSVVLNIETLEVEISTP